MEGLPTPRPQVAYLDHVFAVVDADTADAIAGCDFLTGFGKFEVATVVADGETWTGRYLFGCRTYVELFGPGDVDAGEEGSAGLGLSTRERGGLGILSDRMKDTDGPFEVKQRTRQEGDDQVPWFDFLGPAGASRVLSAWVMEFLTDPNDLQRRESAFVEWTTAQSKDSRPEGRGPFVRDIILVELGATADDIAIAEPLLTAAGFVATRSGEMLLVHDAETTILLHATSRDSVGLRRVEFVLTATAAAPHVEAIGRTRLAVGPGDRAVWDFTSL